MKFLLFIVAGIVAVCVSTWFDVKISEKESDTND